jgi:hypothetical protein
MYKQYALLKIRYVFSYFYIGNKIKVFLYNKNYYVILRPKISFVTNNLLYKYKIQHVTLCVHTYIYRIHVIVPTTTQIN